MTDAVTHLCELKLHREPGNLIWGENVLKIGLILTPIEFGGAERVSLNLLSSIDRKKFNIFPILLIRPWENKSVFAKEIEKIGYSHFDIPVAKWPANQGRDFFRVLRCFKILFSKVSRENFELLHTNGYFADIIGIPIAKLLGIPIVTTCHGYILTDRRLSFYNRIDKFFLCYTGKVISVSTSIKTELLKAKVPDNKITILQNAVNIPDSNESKLFECGKIRQEYGLGDKDVVLGYIGRLSVEKGLITLVKAVKLFRNKFQDLSIKVFIVGNGPERNALEREVIRNNLEPTFIFSGFQDDISIFLNLFDICVLPSLTEGTPMALLEAMAYGLPTIATTVGGVPSIINSGINGILVNPSNPEELADAIFRTIKDKTLRRLLGKKAVETIKQNFNLDNWAKRMEEIYLNVLKS